MRSPGDSYTWGSETDLRGRIRARFPTLDSSGTASQSRSVLLVYIISNKLATRCHFPARANSRHPPRDGSAQSDNEGEYVVSYQVVDQQPTEVKLSRGDTIFVKRKGQAAAAGVVGNFEQPHEQGRGHPGQLRYKLATDPREAKPKELQPSRLLHNVIKPTLEAREGSAVHAGAGPAGSAAASPAKKKAKDDQKLRNQRRALRQDFCKALNGLQDGQQLEILSWKSAGQPVEKHGLVWQPLEVLALVARGGGWANCGWVVERYGQLWICCMETWLPASW